MKMAAVTKFIARHNETTPSTSRTTRLFWRLNAKLNNNLRLINFTEGSVLCRLADVTGVCGHHWECFYYDPHTAMKSPPEFYTFGSHFVFLQFWFLQSYLVGNRHVKAIEDIEEESQTVLLLSWLRTNWEPSAFYYCPPYSCKGLVNVHKFCVHVYKITR